MAMEGKYEVAFTSWVAAPSACPEWDWVSYGFGHLQSDFSDDGIRGSYTDLQFDLLVNVSSILEDHDFRD